MKIGTNTSSSMENIFEPSIIRYIKIKKNTHGQDNPVLPVSASMFIYYERCTSFLEKVTTVKTLIF